MPHLYSIEGAADPLPVRVERVRQACGNPAAFRSFSSDEELLSEEKFADVLVIGTQDSMHFEPCLKAMELGYDILLEKPIATCLDEVLYLARRAEELGRRVLVCHVLRYTPFYRKVKEVISSGVLGEIVSLNASEGVNPWHQAHSFVRGHWAVTEKATPMIIAKSCHDMDVISWLMDQACLRLSSSGSLMHFHSAHAPVGAPLRCTSGCPVQDSCSYNALRYLQGEQRAWLKGVWDGGDNDSDEAIIDWLKVSPWGRCVYHCDNTAVDHQVVSMEFASGSTATFTMTAFDTGRNIEIFGTKGVLRGGEAVLKATGAEIQVTLHANLVPTKVSVDLLEGGYDGHGGGDMGLMMALYDEMRCAAPSEMSTSIASSVQSHVMGFAAETARLERRVVDLSEFAASQRRVPSAAAV